MAQRGKRMIEARSLVDREREHSPAEAIAAIKRISNAKFDESIELHIRTGLNVRHADEQLRGTIALPNGLGRDVTIAVFAQGDAAREAQEAGADFLGPSGKMPNPKVGTVTTDVRKAVEESKSGKVEYKTDRTAIVHLVIGKRSFEHRALLENYAAVIEEVIRAKPSVAKGRYLRSITIASTQGPGIKVDPTRTRDIVEEAPAVAA